MKDDVTFIVSGLQGYNEENMVESILGRIIGVIDVQASAASSSIYVVYNPEEISHEDLKKVIEESGFKIVKIEKELDTEDVTSAIVRKEQLDLLKRALVGLISVSYTHLTLPTTERV